MDKKIIKTHKAPQAIGPYSQAIKSGNFIFASGQIPLDPVSGNMAENDIKKQTERVMENIKGLLETMSAYFANHGNLLKAAEMMFIHRNTMKYRLAQVEKLLEISLDKENDRLKLELALYIYRQNYRE